MINDRLYVVESKGFWGQAWAPETYKVTRTRSGGRVRLAQARADEAQERSYRRRGKPRNPVTYRLAVYVRQQTAK